MQTLHIVSFTLLYVLAVNAQSIGSGTCPQPPVQQNFDPAKVENVLLFLLLLVLYTRGSQQGEAQGGPR